METTTLSEMNNERQVICNNEKNDESTKSKFEKLSNFTCDGYVDPKNSTNITVRTKATSEKHNLDDIAVHEEETNKNDNKDNLNHLHDVKQQKFQTASLRRSRRISSSAYRRKPLIFALNVNRVIVKVNQKIELVIDCDNRKNNFNEIKLNNFSQKIKNLKQVASNVSEAYESNSISSSNVLRRSRRLSLDLPSPSQMILSPASKKDNRNNVNSSKKPENLKPAAVATYTSKENEIKNEVSRSSERPLRRSRRLSLDPPLSIHSHLASSSNKPADASNISKESTINNAVNLSPKRPLRRSRRLSLEPPLPLETSVKTSLSFDVSKRKGGRRKKRKKSIVLDPNRIIPVLPILQPEQSILNPPSYHSHSSSPINSESHECQQHQPLKKVKHNRSVVFHSPRAAFYKIQSFPGEFEVMQKETVKSLFSIGPNTAEQKNNELETIKSKNNEINSLISDELVQPLDSSKKEIASFDDLSSVRNTSSQHNIDENSCQYNQNSSKQIEEEEQSIGHRIQNNHETEVMKQYEAAELGNVVMRQNELVGSMSKVTPSTQELDSCISKQMNCLSDGVERNIKDVKIDDSNSFVLRNEYQCAAYNSIEGGKKSVAYKLNQSSDTTSDKENIDPIVKFISCQKKQSSDENHDELIKSQMNNELLQTCDKMQTAMKDKSFVNLRKETNLEGFLTQ